MSVRALIVEDEPLARKRLRELVRDVPWLECVGEAANGLDAVKAIDELRPDLVSSMFSCRACPESTCSRASVIRPR